MMVSSMLRRVMKETLTVASRVKICVTLRRLFSLDQGISILQYDTILLQRKKKEEDICARNNRKERNKEKNASAFVISKAA